MSSTESSSKGKAGGELVSPSQKRLRFGSTPTTPPRSPLYQPQRLSDSPLVSALVTDQEDDEDAAIVCRIRSGIKYLCKQQRNGVVAKQSTRICLRASSSSSLDLLRQYGTKVCTSNTHGVYGLAVPRPDWVPQGNLPGIHDPQWWFEKSLAEVKAGPHADENCVRLAASWLQGQETKNKKRAPTARGKEIEWKLKEGTRRQGFRFRMFDSESDEVVEVDKEECKESE